MSEADALVLTREATNVGRQRDLYRARNAGELVRLRHGVFTPASAVDQANTEARYRAEVQAAMAVRRAPVATSVSATALLGLPLFGAAPQMVYLLSPRLSGRRRNGVVEIGRRDGEVVVDRGGLLMTDVAFSIVQACRHTPFMAALVIVESAIHEPRLNGPAPLATLDELWAVYDRLLPFPRSARVRAVLEYATVHADTPLETVSRVIIDDLGFPEPVQQHELWLPRIGQRAFFDFAWPEYRIAGEADGWGKYLDGRFGPRLDPVERFKHEKRRDDAIRGVRWMPAHWEWRDVLHREQLAAILLEAGLPRTRRPRRIR